MNDGMNPDQIERVFGALGRIEQKIDSHTSWMETHVKEDREMAANVKAIEIRMARQKGFIAALAGVGSFVAGAVGYFIEFLLSGRGHH